MKKVLFLSLIIVVVVMFLAACGASGSGGPDVNEVDEAVPGTISEVLRKEECTISEAEKTQGYTEKYIVQYRYQVDRSVEISAFLYDGYTWRMARNIGCPNIQ